MSEPNRGINAFEQGGSTGWIRGFGVAVRDLLKEPTQTFQEMDKEGPMGLAFLFALLVLVIPELLTIGVELLAPGALGWFGPGLEGTMDDRIAGSVDYLLKYLGLFATDPLTTPPLLWVTFKALRWKTPSFRTIFRVSCYAGAPAMLGFGIVGTAVVSLWGLFLLCLGIKLNGGPRPIAVLGAMMLATIVLGGGAIVAIGVYNSMG